MSRPYLTALALLALAGVAASPAAAGETDQYLAWSATLDDSSDEINSYLNAGIETALTRLDRPRRLACEEVPPKIYRYLFHGLLRSRLRHYLDEDPSIDRYPGAEVKYFRYLRSSLFRGPAFPFFMPMSRTIDVAGVHLGIDKVNHIFGFGRRYYNRYRRHLRRGRDEPEAVRRTVLWGLTIERYFVGGMIDGILSYADLEANYQGLRLARDLCEAEPPHLALEGGRWRLARPVDIRGYVNPRLDETYNENQYTWWRWRQVRKILETEVCPRLAEPSVHARWARYRRLDRPSRAERILAEHLSDRQRQRRQEQSLLEVCPAGLVALIEPPNTRWPARSGRRTGAQLALRGCQSTSWWRRSAGTRGRWCCWRPRWRGGAPRSPASSSPRSWPSWSAGTPASARTRCWRACGCRWRGSGRSNASRCGRWRCSTARRNFGVLAQVLEVEPDEALELCRELVGLGLAEAEGPYLLPDPALGPAVEGELDPQERERLETRWLEATSRLGGLLVRTADPRTRRSPYRE